MTDVNSIAKAAREASREVAKASTAQKNAALARMRELLGERAEEVVEANNSDMAEARKNGLAANLTRRLVFDRPKVEGRVRSLEKIEGLPDPVGQVQEMEKRPNGLLVGRMRVPIGVILMIYEARPHVTVNAGAFALKSGNAIILKGGKESAGCNALIGELWGEALTSARLPSAAVQCVSATHEEVSGLLQMTDCIDLVIPRGGKNLIQAVVRESSIPVIKHLAGVCHVYVDGDADPEKAKRIAANSKLLMPEVCNAAETLLVAEERAGDIPALVGHLRAQGVEVRGCDKTREYAPDATPATEEDWSTEYLDKIISVKVVPGVEGAIRHIADYGSGHTDTIVTENYTNAQTFLREVDSGVVLVNASTMFDDGEELGMGAEIGISTDKLHARGPMGLKELTTYKFIVMGDDHVKDS